MGSEVIVLPPPDNDPVIDLNLQDEHEEPQLVVEQDVVQPEAPSAQDEGLAQGSRPVRRRQPRQGHISQEVARRTLIELGKSRLKLEEKQTEALLKQTAVQEQMLHTLNKIADAIDK